MCVVEGVCAALCGSFNFPPCTASWLCEAVLKIFFYCLILVSDSSLSQWTCFIMSCLDFASRLHCNPLVSLDLGCWSLLYKPPQRAFPSEVAILNSSAPRGTWSPSVASRKEPQHSSSVTSYCIRVTSLVHIAQIFNFIIPAYGKDDKAWLLIWTQIRWHVQTYLHRLIDLLCLAVLKYISSL